MPIILDQALYNRIKKEADQVYRKPSAYKSGYIIKRYKEEGGEYANDNKPKNLKRWFEEEWGDIGGKEYPVYRPTKRVSSETPLTASEIDPVQAREQIKLKQKIKGEANLPPFLPKPKISGEGMKNLENYSNPDIVREMADKYLGKDVPIYYSTKKDKKYMVQNPEGKWVHFGQYGYEDYTKTRNLVRRNLFRTRNHKWATADKWTPSWLSYWLLW